MLVAVAILVGVFVLAIGTMAVIGLNIRSTHSVTVTRKVDASPEKIWAVLTDIEDMPTWRKELGSVKVLDSLDGKPRWIEKSKFGDITFQMEVADKPTCLVTQIDGKDLPFGGKWTWMLKPSGVSTEVTVTEDGEINSPIFRFMAKHVFGYSKTLETYLDQLVKRLQEVK